MTFAVDHKMRVHQQPAINVLALDGGGVRGVIHGVILTEIEKRTHQATVESFDLISGTSTGGLIACCLTVPGVEPGKPKFSASYIVESYESLSSKAFTRTWSSYLYGPKYGSDGLETVVKEYVGETYLRDALTELVIPAQGINPLKPWLFERASCRKKREFYDLKMIDVIQATTAAPTYFSPKIISFNEKDFGFIDGGMCANNPTAMAFAACDHIFDQPKFNVVLSIGTGAESISLNPHQAKGYGLIDWLIKGDLVNITFAGNPQAVDMEMHSIFSKHAQNAFYRRLDPKIKAANASLDNTSAKNIRELKEQTESYIKEHPEEIEEISKKLDKDKGDL